MFTRCPGEKIGDVYLVEECGEMKKTDAVQRDLVMEGIVRDVGRSKSEGRNGILLTNQQ